MAVEGSRRQSGALKILRILKTRTRGRDRNRAGQNPEVRVFPGVRDGGEHFGSQHLVGLHPLVFRRFHRGKGGTLPNQVQRCQGPQLVAWGRVTTGCFRPSPHGCQDKGPKNSMQCIDSSCSATEKAR